MRPVVCYVTDRKALARAPGADPAEVLLEKVRAAVHAGVDWVQIREKDLLGGKLLPLTLEALASVRDMAPTPGSHRTLIYINDRLDVAIAAGAAGVHLGSESMPIADVVRWRRAGHAPVEFQIGASCHSVESARDAARDGANYVFFGPVFDTPSKRGFGPPQGLERLREVCQAVEIPVIAIGGVNEANADECIRAGASGIAAIRFFQEAATAEKIGGFVSRLRAAGNTQSVRH